MDLKVVSLFASALLVGGSCIFGPTGANADGPIALTSAELDDVTALARYAPAQLGELREAAGDDVTFEFDRLRRQIAREIDGVEPARPMAERHAMPAMAPMLTPAAAEAPPPVTSAPATPAPQASGPMRQLRSVAARMPQTLGNRAAADRGFSPRP